MMERLNAKLPIEDTHEGRRLALQERIDAQIMLVSRLRPGTDAHRLATDTLLLFQDTLYILNEAERLLRIVQKRSSETPTQSSSRA